MTRPTLKPGVRITHGLHWRSTNPTLYDFPRARTGLVRTLIALLAVLLLWSLAMTMDYADQARAAEAASEQRANMLGECVAGRLVLTYPNDSGAGYSRTAVKCREAHEFNI